jgi:signal transduction histidine kinase
VGASHIVLTRYLVVKELDIQPFILSELVNDAAAMFRVAASKKGLDFRAEHSDLYEGEITGDLPRLRQVLLNLLANSVKFTKYGFITLRCTQDRESTSSIRVKFTVEDSGIGIAKNVIPTLFQAFQQADSTTSRQHGGTGLGLAISKNVSSPHKCPIAPNDMLINTLTQTACEAYGWNSRTGLGAGSRDSDNGRNSFSKITAWVFQLAASAIQKLAAK